MPGVFQLAVADAADEAQRACDLGLQAVLLFGIPKQKDEQATSAYAEVERALATRRAPEIHNTDQGSQFTSAEWLDLLEGRGIRVSLDGRGRAFDNIFIERLWRTVKWEHVFLWEHRTMGQLRSGLAEFFEHYNHRRWHSALANQPPATVYER